MFWRLTRLRRSILFYFLLIILGWYYFFGLKHVDDILSIEYKKFAHPLENTCKYPILFPEDPNLSPYIQHGRRLQCPPSQEEFVHLNDDFLLTVDQQLAERKFGQHLDCYYRPVAGGIQPRPTDIIPIWNWTRIGPVTSAFVYEDIIEVRCYLANQSNILNLLKMEPKVKNETEVVFHYAFAQIGRPVKAANVEDVTGTRQPPVKYGLDILVLDSTSLNMFRRHAFSSWKYMKKHMGFLHFNGYTKVADNSLVNLIPLLAGLRYFDSGDGVSSDLPVNKPLNSDEVPLLWRQFKAANCATMFNDDIAVAARGFWNYPKQWTPGFRSKPTDHFYRPWNLYHRTYPIPGSDKFCFGSRPYFQDVIRLTEQMIRRYRDQCHFSFNFLTDLTHDDTNNLELLDGYLKETLQRLHERGHLENTILVIMGDHGNRVNLIRYRYVGRIEERMPLFAVYFPPSFRQRYPDQMRILTENQHRLVSHFDAYQMFRDILLGTIDNDEKISNASTKGTSLFRPIPASRTCKDANIPENHCTCLDIDRRLDPHHNPADAKLIEWSTTVIRLWTNNRCGNRTHSITVKQISVLTINQYVQHGVRHLTDDKATMNNVKKYSIVGDIEYLDIVYDVHRIDSTKYHPITAMIRLQHNLKLKKLLVNIEPLVIKGPIFCDNDAISRGCVCMFDCILYCT